MKRCTMCGLNLPHDQFDTDRQKRDGLYSACKPCKRRTRTETRAKLVALKLTLACSDCGWEPADEIETAGLEFDHTDPSSKGQTWGKAYNIGWPWPRIERELALCTPRCARCHAIRTYREQHHLIGKTPMQRTTPDHHAHLPFDTHPC